MRCMHPCWEEFKEEPNIFPRPVQYRVPSWGSLCRVVFIPYITYWVWHAKQSLVICSTINPSHGFYLFSSKMGPIGLHHPGLKRSKSHAGKLLLCDRCHTGLLFIQQKHHLYGLSIICLFILSWLTINVLTTPLDARKIRQGILHGHPQSYVNPMVKIGIDSGLFVFQGSTKRVQK